MNHKDNNAHFTEDELIAFLVDERDLPSKRRAHLYQCELCNKRKEGIQQQLRDIRQQAEFLVPAFSKKLRLPASRTARSIGFRRYWVPALGSSLAIMLVITATWWFGVLPFPFKTNRVDTNFTESDDVLLMQIGNLIDNPLPVSYREIGVMVDFDMNDEMTDFIVPSIENGHEAFTTNNTSGVRT